MIVFQLLFCLHYHLHHDVTERKRMRAHNHVLCIRACLVINQRWGYLRLDDGYIRLGFVCCMSFDMLDRFPSPYYDRCDKESY